MLLNQRVGPSEGPSWALEGGGMDGRTDGRMDGNSPPCSTGLRPLWVRCPKAGMLEIAALKSSFSVEKFSIWYLGYSKYRQMIIRKPNNRPWIKPNIRLFGYLVRALETIVDKFWFSSVFHKSMIGEPTDGLTDRWVLSCRCKDASSRLIMPRLTLESSNISICFHFWWNRGWIFVTCW